MRPGRNGLISLRVSSSVSALSSPSRKNSGLKPISSGSPANGREGLAGLAYVRGLRRPSSAPSEKRSRSGAFLLRAQAHPADHLEQLVAAHPQLVLVGLGQQLLVVRKAPSTKREESITSSTVNTT